MWKLRRPDVPDFIIKSSEVRIVNTKYTAETAEEAVDMFWEGADGVELSSFVKDFYFESVKDA